jgi:mannose/fructose-specific phosphotransferase system component IIA
MAFSEPGRVEILTGVNLPMVLRLACQSTEEGSLSEVAHWLQAKSQRSLCLVSDMVQSPKCAEAAAAVPAEKKHG